MTITPDQVVPAGVLMRLIRTSSGTERAFRRACASHWARASAPAACKVTVARSALMLIWAVVPRVCCVDCFSARTVSS